MHLSLNLLEPTAFNCTHVSQKKTSTRARYLVVIVVSPLSSTNPLAIRKRMLLRCSILSFFLLCFNSTILDDDISIQNVFNTNWFTNLFSFIIFCYCFFNVINDYECSFSLLRSYVVLCLHWYTLERFSVNQTIILFSSMQWKWK